MPSPSVPRLNPSITSPFSDSPPLDEARTEHTRPHVRTHSVASVMTAWLTSTPQPHVSPPWFARTYAACRDVGTEDALVLATHVFPPRHVPPTDMIEDDRTLANPKQPMRVLFPELSVESEAATPEKKRVPNPSLRSDTTHAPPCLGRVNHRINAPLIVPVLTDHASGNDGWLRRATMCSSCVVVAVVVAAHFPPSPLGGACCQPPGEDD